MISHEISLANYHKQNFTRRLQLVLRFSACVQKLYVEISKELSVNDNFFLQN